MPNPILRLDLLEGAQLVTRFTGGRHVRVGHIQNLNVRGNGDGDNDIAAFHKALSVAGMPQMGDRHPTGDGTVVVQHMFRGVSNDQVRVEIVYETPGGFEIPDTIFILEDDTTLVSRSTLKIPGINQFVRVQANFAQPLNVYNYYYGVPPTPVVGDSPPFNYLCPLRTLRYRQLVLIEPKPYLANVVGTVNDRDWRGFPAGYWMCAHIGNTIRTFDKNDKPGAWLTSGAFVTKVREDWTEWLALRGPDGRYFKAEPVGLENLGKVSYPDVRITYNGQALIANATRVAPYDMADFHAIFGL